MNAQSDGQPITLQEILNRPKAYYNIDGVGELGMGFFLLGYVLLAWLQGNTAKDSFWNQMYGFAIYFGLMLSIIHYGSKAIKTYITYPRTGFVEYRRRDKFWRAIMGAVVGALVPIAIVVALRSHWDITASVTSFGLLCAACYAWGIVRTVRWKWVVVCLVAAGSIAIPALPADLVGSLANHPWLFFLLFCGAMLAVSGGVSLWLYVRHTQAPTRETA